MCRFTRCGMISLPPSPSLFRRDVDGIQAGHSGATDCYFHPFIYLQRRSFNFFLFLLPPTSRQPIPTSGFNPSWDYRRKRRINNKSPLSTLCLLVTLFCSFPGNPEWLMWFGKKHDWGFFFFLNKFLGLRTSAHTGIPAEYKVKLEK